MTYILFYDILDTNKGKKEEAQGERKEEEKKNLQQVCVNSLEVTFQSFHDTVNMRWHSSTKLGLFTSHTFTLSCSASTVALYTLNSQILHQTLH